MGIVLNILLLALGFAMLVKGADWFVDGTSGIAARWGIPQLVIGLTVVAMGTSLPEASVSIAGALKGSADISVGNVVGSNILNVLIILGLASAITAIPVAKSTQRVEIPFTILITLVLLLFGISGNVLTWVEGLGLLALFVLYLLYLFRMAKKDRQEEEEGAEKKPWWKLILATVVGLALIVLGSSFTVDAATAIARALGMSERFIGLTIVALGTSLPELFTSVAAAIKKNADIAIGNIVGSNVFNILFVLGTSAVITPVPFAACFVVDTIIAAAAVLLLLLFSLKGRKLGRVGGITMLACYGGYFAYLLMK